MDHPSVSEPGTNICPDTLTELHELAAFNVINYKYLVTKQEGPLHKKLYTVELQLSHERYEAVGPSIKKAQESVARVALERTEWFRPRAQYNHESRNRLWDLPPVDRHALAEQLGFLNIDDPEPLHNANIVPIEETAEPMPATEQSPATDAYLENHFKTCITLLNEYALKNKFQLVFKLLDSTGPSHRKTFTIECRVGEMKAQGKGHSKKGAKADAAYNLCREYEKLAIPLIPHEVSAVSKKKRVRPKKQHLVNLLRDDNQEIGSVSKLNQMCQAKKEKLPIYTLMAVVGHARKRGFVIEVTARSAMSFGLASTKREAKSKAARSLLDLIQCLDRRQPGSSPQGAIILQANEENVENAYE